MSVFSWRRWLDRLVITATKTPRGKRQVRPGSYEHLEERTLLSAISLVKDINPGPNDSVYTLYSEPTFIKAGATLFFRADDGVDGIELWKSDGTNAGTVLVADLATGEGLSAGPYIYDMTAAGGKVYFQFDDGVHGREMWVSDGTLDGTMLLKDINPNGSSVIHDPYALDVATIDGTLYFLADDGVHGRELWKTNGTDVGTVMVADLTVGNNYNSYVYEMTAAGGKLFFIYNEVNLGLELWTSDGTETGTQLVKDINPDGSGLYVTYYYRLPMVDLNGTLFFIADDGVHGTEIWKSNGTEAGTVMVADLTPGAYNSYIHGMTVAGDQLFFVFDDTIHGFELWSSDGTEDGTNLVSDINPNGDSLYSVVYGADLVNVDGTLFFLADDGVHGIELWKSNGTDAGTLLVADLSTVPDQSANSYLTGMTAAGGLLYFAFDDGVHGLELWQSDGTFTGTFMVQDLNPDGDGIYPGYYYGFAADLGGTLVFLGTDGQTGTELYRVVDDDQPQPPVFNAQSFNLAENAVNGTVVGTLVASDPNGGPRLQFTITNGNGSGAFALNSSTGRLTVADSTALDFETTPSIELTVQVKNAANLTTTATVTINLTDVNEAPVLSPATFDLNLNSANGAAVGTVTATDPDAGQQLTYSITNGNTSNAFAIDPATGAITVANAATLDLNVNPVFHLSIQVTDNGVPPKPATTTVTVNLFDPNDQNDIPVLALNGGAPTFVKKSAPVAIAPNITVVDPDLSAAFRLAEGTLTLSIDLASKKKRRFDTIGGLTNVNAIGSIADQGTVNGRFQVIVQLNDSATAQSIQNYLRSLTFTTKGAGLKRATRIVQAQVTDAAGAGSNILQQTITVLKKAAP